MIELFKWFWEWLSCYQILLIIIKVIVLLSSWREKYILLRIIKIIELLSMNKKQWLVWMQDSRSWQGSDRSPPIYISSHIYHQLPIWLANIQPAIFIFRLFSFFWFLDCTFWQGISLFSQKSPIREEQCVVKNSVLQCFKNVFKGHPKVFLGF